MLGKTTSCALLDHHSGPSVVRRTRCLLVLSYNQKAPKVQEAKWADWRNEWQDHGCLWLFRNIHGMKGARFTFKSFT